MNEPMKPKKKIISRIIMNGLVLIALAAFFYFSFLAFKENSSRADVSSSETANDTSATAEPTGAMIDMGQGGPPDGAGIPPQ